MLEESIEAMLEEFIGERGLGAEDLGLVLTSSVTAKAGSYVPALLCALCQARPLLPAQDASVKGGELFRAGVLRGSNSASWVSCEECTRCG